jgi:hypothetical protein
LERGDEEPEEDLSKMVKDWRGEANWRGVRDVLLDIDGDFRAVAMEEEVRRSGVRMAVYFMMLCWWILDNCGCYMDGASKSRPSLLLDVEAEVDLPRGPGVANWKMVRLKRHFSC